MQQEKRDLLLHFIAVRDLQLALSLVTTQELVRAIPWIAPELSHSEDFPQLCPIAVAGDFRQLPKVKKLTDASDYQALCDLALGVSGRALGVMDVCDRTPERVDRAVARKDAPPYSGYSR